MTQNTEAFQLLKDFAAELSSGDLDLPALPRAVVRLQNELSKPGFDVAKVAMLAATEPALAGSILTMANSVAFKRSGKETMDLKVAIPRIGAGKVQALGMRFALRQLHGQLAQGHSRKLLEKEWARSLHVAAACYLVAEKSRAAKPDEAMIVGLIHNIGRIYLCSRADKYPTLFDSPEALLELVENWHANVARAIVESWSLPPEAAEAVAHQGEDDDGHGVGMMAYILRLALVVSALPETVETGSLATLAADRLSRGLKLGTGDLEAIILAREPTRLMLGLAD